MKLINLQDRWQDDTRTISMEVVWETGEKCSKELYFSASGETAKLMIPAIEAFAIAALPLAIWYGEERLLVEGQLCTKLKSGLKGINQVFCEWYPQLKMVHVEPLAGFTPTEKTSNGRVVSLLSGGVDGLATLRQNRLDYPLEHSESINACITLFGINNFDLDESGPVPERLQAFSEVVERLQGLADRERFQLLPVHTNVRSLGLEYKAWTAIGFGPGHIAAVHLFGNTFGKALYSSDGAGPNPPPSAYHPLINLWYSSCAITVNGDQDEMSRDEKVALLAEWPEARQLMQPCHYIQIPEQGKINCGRCEKCVRTMLLLVGLGRLSEVSAFTEDDVTSEMVQKIPVHNDEKALLLLQSVPLLQNVGRADLVAAVRKRIRRYKFKKFKQYLKRRKR